MEPIFHDLSDEAVQKLQPTDALQKHLENAQLAHRLCIAKAMKEEQPIIEKCALTWGEVLIRYQAWAQYRQPFRDTDAMKKYNKHWTKKRQQADDNNVFKN